MQNSKQKQQEEALKQEAKTYKGYFTNLFLSFSIS
jgi:hypothetical protein